MKKLALMLLATLLACPPPVALAQDARAADRAAPTERRADPSTYDLGAVIARRDEGGATIMAVTPGGGAERMELRVGDLLLSINGLSLDTPNPNSAIRQALQAGAGTARVEAARDGRIFVVHDAIPAPVHERTAGAMRGCSHVSGVGPTPMLSENIFPLRIARVAGARTRPQPADGHRVAAGRQVLVVFEQIPETRFSTTQLVQRGRMLRQLDARAGKVLMLDVEPGKKYHVGAQLLPGRMSRRDMLDNQYWRPVVWKEEPGRCR